MSGAEIKVIGLGGAGCNAVNRMIELGLSGVEFIAANTDSQALSKSLADNRIQLGEKLTRGLGAGADPEIGEKAALETQDVIAEHLDGADLVFITAGMGGGTGTGAAPVVADIARGLGALTVAVVTKPFEFEGPHRAEVAKSGIERLRGRVDALVVVDNNKLLKISDRKLTVTDAFLMADEVLYHGVRGISDVINRAGLINVDFADVRRVLSGAGQVLMGIGTGKGDARARDASEAAINSPLLEHSIKGAHRILLNIVGDTQTSINEAQEIAEHIRNATGVKNPDVFFGLTLDPHLEGEIQVILIAAGFEDEGVLPGGEVNPATGDLEGDLRIPAVSRRRRRQ